MASHALPRLKLFVNGWSWAYPQSSKLDFFTAAKKASFHGVEMSLSDLGNCSAQRRETAAMLHHMELELICGVYSSWADYEGSWQRLAPSVHLKQLERELAEAASLGPSLVHVNAHSGCDSWSDEETTDYLASAQQLSSNFEASLSNPDKSVKVSHETHRGRCFYHPYRTARLLKGTTLDQLSLTLDLSHWHVVGERNDVNCPEERALIQQLAPRVLHVHARIGGAQRPQVHYHEMPSTTSTSFSPPSSTTTEDSADLAHALAAPHVAAWQDVWKAQWKMGAFCVMATPEYGPSPYMPSLLSPMPPLASLRFPHSVTSAASTSSISTSSSLAPSSSSSLSLSSARVDVTATAADVLWAQTLAGAVNLREVHENWSTNIHLK